MKILTKLIAGASADTDARPRSGIRMGHDAEISSGQFVRHQITDAGLFLETLQGKQTHQVLIPLSELHALAGASNPAFLPKKK